MALVDDIEFYGRAVEAGDMTREEAVRLLVKASAGGLTEVGARTCIADWGTVRARYTEEMIRASEMLAELRWLL